MVPYQGANPAMIDTIQTLADRLAEALHGNPTTIQTPHGLVILAAQPATQAAEPTPPQPVAAPATVEPPKADPITPTELRALARQAAAKVGADKVRETLGKSIIELKPSEVNAVAARLRALL